MYIKEILVYWIRVKFLLISEVASFLQSALFDLNTSSFFLRKMLHVNDRQTRAILPMVKKRALKSQTQEIIE